MSNYKDRYSFAGKAVHNYGKELLKKALAEKKSMELDNRRSAQSSSALQALRCYSPGPDTSPIMSPSENRRWGQMTEKSCVTDHPVREYPHQNPHFHSLYTSTDTNAQNHLKSILKLNKTDKESEDTVLSNSEITLPFSMDNIENEDEFLYGASNEEPINMQHPNAIKVKDSNNWSDEEDYPEHHSVSQSKTVISHYAGGKSEYFEPPVNSLNKYTDQEETKTKISKEGLLDGITIDVDLQSDSWDNPSGWDEPVTSPRRAVSPVLDIFQEDDNQSTWKYISEWKNSSVHLEQSSLETSDSARKTQDTSLGIQCNPSKGKRVLNSKAKVDSAKVNTNTVNAAKSDSNTAYASNSNTAYAANSNVAKSNLNAAKAISSAAKTISNAAKTNSIKSNTLKTNTFSTNISKLDPPKSTGWHNVQVFDPGCPDSASLDPTCSALFNYSKYSSKKKDEDCLSRKILKLDFKSESLPNYQLSATDHASVNSQSTNFSNSCAKFQLNEQRVSKKTFPVGNATEPSKTESDTTLKLLPHPVQKLRKHSAVEMDKENVKDENQSVFGKQQQIDSIEKFFDSKTRDKKGNTDIANMQSIFKFLNESNNQPSKRTVYSDSEHSAHPRVCSPEKRDFEKLNSITVRTSNSKLNFPPTRVVRLKTEKDSILFGGDKKYISPNPASSKLSKRNRSESPEECGIKHGKYSRGRANLPASEIHEKKSNDIDENGFRKKKHGKNVRSRSPKHLELDKSNKISRDRIPRRDKLRYSKDALTTHSKGTRRRSIDVRSPGLLSQDKSPRYSPETSPEGYGRSPERYGRSPERYGRSPERYERSPRRHEYNRRYPHDRSPRRYSRDRSPRQYSSDRSPSRYSYERSPSRYSHDRSPGRYKSSGKYDRSPCSDSPVRSHRRLSSSGSEDDEILSPSPKQVVSGRKFQQRSNLKPTVKKSKKDLSENAFDPGIFSRYEVPSDAQSVDQTSPLINEGKLNEISMENKDDKGISVLAKINNTAVSRVSDINETVVDTIHSDSQNSQLRVSEESSLQPVQQHSVASVPPYSSGYQHSFYDQKMVQPPPYYGEGIQPGYYPPFGQPYNFYNPPFSTEVARLPLPPAPFNYSNFYSATNPPQNVEHYPEQAAAAAFAKHPTKPNKSSNTRTLTSVPLQKNVNSPPKCDSFNSPIETTSLNLEMAQTSLTSERTKELLSRKAGIRKQVANLNSEYSKLCKLQGEYMRKKRREKDGHKDQIIQDYGKLQDEIKNKLRDLLDETKAVEKELQKLAAEAHAANTELVESVSTPEVPIVEIKTVIQTSDSAPISEVPSKQIEYYDPGSHWCKLCNKLLLTLPAMLEHLHSNDHKQHLDPMDRPWASESPKTSNKKKLLKQEKLDVAAMKGGQFLMPIEGFYCSLCKQMFGDKVCANDHLLTNDHNKAYEQYTVDNPIYERRWVLDKLSGLAIMDKEEKKRKADVERLLLNKHKKKEVEEMTNAKKREEENVKTMEMIEFEDKIREDTKRAAEAALRNESIAQKQDKKGIRMVFLDGKYSEIAEKKKEMTEIKSKQKFVYIGKAPNYKPRVATPKLDPKIKDENNLTCKEGDVGNKSKKMDSAKKFVSDGASMETNANISTSSINVNSLYITGNVIPSLPTEKFLVPKTSDSTTDSVSCENKQKSFTNTPQLLTTISTDSKCHANSLNRTPPVGELYKAEQGLIRESFGMDSKVLPQMVASCDTFKQEYTDKYPNSYLDRNLSGNNITEGNLSASKAAHPSKPHDMIALCENILGKASSRAEEIVKNPNGRYNSVLINVPSNTIKDSIPILKCDKQDDVVEINAAKPISNKVVVPPKPKMKKEGPIHGPLTEEEEDFLLLGINKEDMTPLAVPKPPPSSLIRQHSLGIQEGEKSSSSETQVDTIDPKSSILTVTNFSTEAIEKNENSTANIDTSLAKPLSQSENEMADIQNIRVSNSSESQIITDDPIVLNMSEKDSEVKPSSDDKISESLLLCAKDLIPVQHEKSDKNYVAAAIPSASEEGIFIAPEVIEVDINRENVKYEVVKNLASHERNISTSLCSEHDAYCGDGVVLESKISSCDGSETSVPDSSVIAPCEESTTSYFKVVTESSSTDVQIAICETKKFGERENFEEIEKGDFEK